jgi:hypothetical protein
MKAAAGRRIGRLGIRNVDAQSTHPDGDGDGFGL